MIGAGTGCSSMPKCSAVIAITWARKSNPWDARVYLGLYRRGDEAAQQAALTLASVQVAAERSAQGGPQTHVAYKPVVAAEPRKSSEWFALPSMFKLCSHERETLAGEQEALDAAREELRLYSGTPIFSAER